MNKDIEATINQLREKSNQHINDKLFVEPIHENLVNELDNFFEYPVQKNEVIPVWFGDFPQLFSIIGPQASFFVPGYNIIGLNLITIRLAGGSVDIEGNEVDPPDTGDLYSVLAHEYFHSIFHDNYHFRLKKLFNEETKNNWFGLLEGPKIKAINEAFAFWGQKVMTGEDFLGSQDNSYLDAYENDGLNTDTLKQTYNLLKEYEKSQGKKYVADNLVKIVNDHLVNQK
ncbi:hypothetical protein HY837_04675 [archaeon]|nr:hypothetical protein [archaeon]